MMSQREPQPRQPPRIAGWLVALFTPAEAEESVRGDLLEEFSAVVSASGYSRARSWYWRQALRIMLDSAGHAIRFKPWLMLATVIGGFWLVGFATRIAHDAMRAYLDAHRIYELHPNAYLFWLKFPLETGRVIVCAVIGALVALAARRIEMAAVVTLALVEMALFFVGAIVLIASGGREWLHWFVDMLPWNVLSAVATIAGGVIVRACRSRPATNALVPGLD